MVTPCLPCPPPHNHQHTCSPQDDAFRPELFYAWPHDRPASTLFYVMSALVAAGVILLTLFPLAPHWLRCDGRWAAAAGAWLCACSAFRPCNELQPAAAVTLERAE